MVAHGVWCAWGAGLGDGNWFDDNSRWVMGNARGTSFWYDNWVGNVPLKVRFPRLFDLTVDREALVVDMATRGWRRGKRLEMEEMPFSVRGGECAVLLCNIVSQDNCNDY